MIHVDDKPFKTTEYRKGHVTMCFPHLKTTEFEFVLETNINGSTRNSVSFAVNFKDKVVSEVEVPDEDLKPLSGLKSNIEWKQGYATTCLDIVAATVLKNVELQKFEKK